MYVFFDPSGHQPLHYRKPEVDYQGAALQHLLHKVKKLKTQK